MHFTTNQINELMHALTDQQRRFASVMADTVQRPHEIWQRWVRNEHDSKQWQQVRYYLQFLDLSETDIAGGFGVVAMQFSWLSRWELSGVGVVLGKQDSVMERIDAEARQGSLEYSIQQH